jgi:protein-S-isoprenylcysteine O-methyltransferase Ste14
MSTNTVSPTSDSTISRRVIKWVVKQIIGLAIIAGILFAAAGRLDWANGWLYFAVVGGSILLTALILIPTRPDLIAERSGPQEGTKKWDIVLVSFVVIYVPMALYVIAGLDARNGWSPPVSSPVQIIAVGIAIIGYLFTLWAMIANRFFATTVRIQEERGHTVATGGPYRYMRHPGYVGALVFYLPSPLILGSLWALIPAALILVLFVIRTALEDRTLQNELDGYREYATQVRYRLLPGIW